MIGRVDGQLRALLRVPLAASLGGPQQDVEAWVDTAFNGGLALPRAVVAGLGLPQEASTDVRPVCERANEQNLDRLESRLAGANGAE